MMADLFHNPGVGVGLENNRKRQTFDSFLNCCRDVDRVSRFLIVADGLGIQDRDIVRRRYPFVEIPRRACS